MTDEELIKLWEKDIASQEFSKDHENKPSYINRLVNKWSSVLEGYNEHFADIIESRPTPHRPHGEL